MFCAGGCWRRHLQVKVKAGHKRQAVAAAVITRTATTPTTRSRSADADARGAQSQRRQPRNKEQDFFPQHGLYLVLSSLVRSHPPNFPKPPKPENFSVGMELASESLPPASQYVKNHVDSFWSRHIPVLLHLTGEVQDEGAPFGSSILRSFYSARAGRGSCSESL
jgi:hypothetical protein